MATSINEDIPGHGVIRRESGDITIEEFAPRSDWSAMGETEHFVQFYETDSFLLNSLGGFIGAGLQDGDACIVVATKEHRASLHESLRATGVDVASATAAGQYLALDAAELLSEFMVDGAPEPARFAKIVGEVIGRAAHAGRRVRIFGEMVALLWAEDNRAAAIQLEELWNDLQKTQSFSLFCAYPMNDLGGEECFEPLGHVCASHARTIPAESYAELASAKDRLRAIIELQQKARSLQAEISERKAIEERLRVSLIQEQLARTEAEHANRLKDEFLATVSHELRTPLHAVLGWTHMLRSGMLDEATAARALETIERNAKSQAQLVEDLLDVSRVITGKLRLSIMPVDVAAVINRAIDAVQLAAESKGIQLTVTFDPSARRVNGDAGRLQQIVWNLLSNAIRFTPTGGRVEVRLERAGADAQIKVSDTGEGISQEFLPFIFDRFRQADGTSTRRHGGLGLGLAIVRYLVELHGGTVEVSSSGKGSGSTFIIRLPLAVLQERIDADRREPEALRPGPETSSQMETLPSLEGIEVLVVDEDPDILNMLTVMLSECKAKVQGVSSAAAALELLCSYRPDVLVSDVAMPEEDGYSLITKVRAMERDEGARLPAVALTAYVRVEDRARALAAGFNIFVPKPVEPKELITAIASLAHPVRRDSLPA